MKKIIVLISILLMMSACSNLSPADKGLTENERINRKFLANYDRKDSYDPMDTVVKTEERSAPGYPADKAYAIFYLDREGVAARIDYYWLENRMLMFSDTSYFEGYYTYKSVFEFNRDFYDNCQKYGLSYDESMGTEKRISYSGTEFNSRGESPGAEEWFYPDGRHAISIYLLAVDEGLYCYSSYEYDKDGNTLAYGYNNPDNSQGYFETNTYENGILTQQVICDYNNGIQKVIEYKNGEVEREESWELERP